MDKISPQLRDIMETISQNEIFVGAYDKIIKSSFLTLLDEAGGAKGISQLMGSVETEEQTEAITEGVNVMLLAITEFKRKNLVDVEIDMVLKEIGFTDDMAAKFVQRYEQFLTFVADKDSEPSNLFDSSINFNKLIDVEWKQEYLLSTKYIKHLNKDNYHISLATLNATNTITPINFKCSIEQLTELVHKLSSAVKNIEAASDLRHFKQPTI